MKHEGEWKPLEVEVSLRKGIAAVKFLGLPDQVAKESVERLKPAFDRLQLPWPKSHIVTINLRPTHLKKHSKGLDLPIALGILAELGFDRELRIDDTKYYYAEVDLEGRLHVPSDLEHFLPLKKETTVITGQSDQQNYFHTERWQNLRSYQSPVKTEAITVRSQLKRPALSDVSFSKTTAKLIQILAVGEHNALLAGPAGSGKTTLTGAIHQVLRDPNETQARSIQRAQSWFHKSEVWRPITNPHHTTPVVAMLGGAVPISAGEVTRAHGGVLVLDELLEFSSRVLEGLREPIESGFITVARRGACQKLPAKFQLIATTNLCPCGSFVPGRPAGCRFSLRKCKSTIERLSGPLLDRFDVLAFSHKWSGDRVVGLKQIFDQCHAAFDFQTLQRRPPARSLGFDELKSQLHPDVLVAGLVGENLSMRRQRALLRVARTLADLSQKEVIDFEHLNQAYSLTMGHFEDMEKLH